MKTLLVMLLCTAGMAEVLHPTPEHHLKDYLYKYGYLPATDLDKGVLRTERELEEATVRLQRFMGLEMTGKLDGPTLDMLGKPRCGVPDMMTVDDGQGIVEIAANYTLSGRRWTRPFTYGFLSYTADLGQESQISIIDTAVSKWTDESRMQAIRVDGNSADIQITFGTGSHNHPEQPFDGELAHASYPTGSSMHFNDFYSFTDGTEDYSLLFVATHELGHNFGIAHSTNGDAIMFPTYHRLAEIDLHQDDIDAIRAIYDRNIALNQPTYQSSLSSGGVSSRGVDGDDNSNYFGNSCTHTSNRGNEWWAVDLGSVVKTADVVITNRADCCSERLQNFRIGLSTASPTTFPQGDISGSYQQCASVSGPLGAGEKRTISCHGVGRYVVIHLIPANPLTLCEVEVYAGMNYALGMPTYQSSTYGGAASSRGVDGNANPNWSGSSCTHTDNTGREFWSVDLGISRTIQRVAITNRADCCSERLRNFTIGPTNNNPQTYPPVYPNYSWCAHVSNALGAGERRIIECEAVARYVFIQILHAEPLTLCEVEVYGA